VEISRFRGGEDSRKAIGGGEKESWNGRFLVENMIPFRRETLIENPSIRGIPPLRLFPLKGKRFLDGQRARKEIASHRQCPRGLEGRNNPEEERVYIPPLKNTLASRLLGEMSEGNAPHLVHNGAERFTAVITQRYANQLYRHRCLLERELKAWDFSGNTEREITISPRPTLDTYMAASNLSNPRTRQLSRFSASR